MGDMINVRGQSVEAAQFLRSDLLGGSAEDFNISLKSAVLANGSRIDFAESGVTVIVGPNNVGKSTLIRELVNRLAAQIGVDSNVYKIVESIDLGERHSVNDLVAWLMDNCTFKVDSGGSGFVRGVHQQPLNLDAVANFWRHDSVGQDRLWMLSPYMVHHSTPFDRMGQVGGAPLRPNFTDPPQLPMHYMQEDDSLRKEIVSYSHRVFGESLTIDFLSGNIQFRVGRTKTAAPPVDDVTHDYLRDLASLPPLHEQGDGMKSLLGLLVPLVATPFPIILVDEPEAFLHPPQAVALGKILGEISKKKDVQIILATHDKNLLAGLMGSEARVSVARLSRSESEVRCDQLKNDDLRELWKNPSLKYSNALDGLFHKLVVIAESDPDCRFYSAALEHLLENSSQDYGLSADDVLFIPSGGLGEMPKLAKALRDLSVPVVASPDMDVVSDSGMLKKLVNVLGGSWDAFKGLDSRMRAPFSAPKSPRTVGVVLTAIQSALKGSESEKYSAEHKKFVEAELYVDSVWREVKRYGLRGFRGDSGIAAQSFMEEVARIGLVPVHAGELESLSNVGVSKGPEWLPAALEAGSHKSDDVQKHLKNILASGELLLKGSRD